MRTGKKFFALSAVLVLCACGMDSFDIKPVPINPPLPAPNDAQPSPIAFSKIRYAVPTGTSVVAMRFAGCEPPYGIVQKGISSRDFPSDDFRRLFLDTMEARGYDVAGDPGRLFDEAEDEMRAAYAVGARVTDIKINACNTINLWGYDSGVSGEATVTVEWGVYDLLRRRNAYKTTTQGYAKIRTANQEGLQLLLEESFEAATANLGADSAFHDLVFYGTKPPAPETARDLEEEPMGLYDPAESVMISNLPVSKSPAAGRLEDIRKTAVMVEAGGGHGSGFFITRDGHIITNAHVVGDAARVRVVTSAKKNKLIAEVLRIDRKRDVALLRIEKESMDGLSIKTLPIRASGLKVGEDVYAIGAPQLKRLQDTVTKGIVSAMRFDQRRKQPYIQADVDIYPGNSGGPLIDANGNIVGISVAGWEIGPDILGGLNQFIPIDDALQQLNIGVQ